MTADELNARAEKIAGWLEHLHETYAAQLSRAEETAALPGFGPGERFRCAYCSVGARCRNALCEDGWVYLPDAYSYDLPKTTTGVRVDESEAAKKARDLARLDASIAALQRDERIRAGIEAIEDPYMRAFRMVSRRPRSLRRILHGLRVLERVRPDLYEALPRRPAMIALAITTPGRIDPAPC